MNKKLIPLLCLAVAAVSVLILVFAGSGYSKTSFYLLGEGEGSFTQRELFFFPDSESGAGLYVGSSGQLLQRERLKWEITTESGTREVSYYLYGNSILPVGDEYVNFYGGNSKESFVVLDGNKKYLVDLASDHTRPLFEGSTLTDPYGEAIDGISANGSYAAGIRDGVLTVLKLQKLTFAPSEQKQAKLAEEGYQNPRFLRFVNGIHLWFTAEKNGREASFLFDCDTNQIHALPQVPEGYAEEPSARVWYIGPAEKTDGGRWEQSVFHAITGESKTLSLSAAEFSSLEILAVSPNGSYAAVKVEKEGRAIWGSASLADSKLTLSDQTPNRVDFASDQVLFFQTAGRYQAIRIVH